VILTPASGPLGGTTSKPDHVEGLPPTAADRQPIETGPWWLWGLVFVVAAAFVTAVIRPFDAGPAAGDAASSVLYFDRILAGQRLEAFVNTTPKPMLTLVYGIAHTITGDWRAVSAISILVMAAAVTLGARLATAISGPLGGLLAAVFLLEVAWAYGLPWLLACVAGAALALLRDPPRYGLAGVLLLLGCLVRQEGFLFVAVATGVLALLAIQGRAPRRAGLVLVAWAALPIILLHDLVLTGDPLYWLRVSAVHAEGLKVASVRSVVHRIVAMIVRNPVLTTLAVLGVVAAWRRPRGWIVATGLMTMAVGTSGLVVFAALTDRVTVGHYYTPISVALGYAATLGAAFLVSGLAHRARAWAARRDAAARQRDLTRTAIRVAALVVALGLGALAIGPMLLDSNTLRSIDRQRSIAIQSDAAARIMAPETHGMATSASSIGPLEEPDPAGYRILVPRVSKVRMAVDLGVPVTVIGPLVPSRPTSGLIHPGLLVYHSSLADPTRGIAVEFEGDGPIVVDQVPFSLVAKGPPGTWIWRAGK
jgi:hypothetical protein